MSTSQRPAAEGKPNTHIWLLVSVASLTVFLRLPWFHDLPLSLDEAFTLRFTENPWSTFWRDAAYYDVHPPLYYSIAKAFRMFGDSEWALRLPSFLFSVLSIPFFYLAGRIVGGPRRGKPLGLAVTAIYCISTMQLAVAQNARSYSLYVLAGAMAFSGLAWAIRHNGRYDVPLRSLAWKPLAAAATSAIGLTLLPWAHNIGLLFAGVFGLSAFFVVLAERGKITGGAYAIVVIGVTALILWSPNLPALLQQLSSVSQGTWIKPVSARELSRIVLSTYGILPNTSGPLLFAGILGSAILAGAGLLGTVKMWQNQRSMALFCLLAAVLPLIGSILFSLLVEPVLLARTLVPSLLPWYVLISYAIVSSTGKTAKSLIGGSVFLVLALNVSAYFLQREKQEPWVRIVKEIRSKSARPAVVITVPNSSELPLKYYNAKLNTRLTIKPIPAPFPAVDQSYVYPSGQLGVPAIDDGMIQAIQRILDLNRGADIWVVLRGHGTYDRSNRIGRLFDDKYCYTPIETGVWYLFVFKVDKKSESRPEACLAHWSSRPPAALAGT